MKKILLILGVLVALAALASGVTIAYAKGSGNDNGNSVQLQERTQPCDQVLLGTVIQIDKQAGTITLLPRGENTNVNITVNSDTRYRSWVAPKQEVTLDSLKNNDWIAVCANNNVARLVVLLQVPEKPFYLRLQGNVTAVKGNVITGNIKGGGNFTIDLTGVSGNFTGAAGQPIELNIGKDSPPAWGVFQSHTMNGLTEGIGIWMRNHGWMMGRGD
jgi:hypothetical protein